MGVGETDTPRIKLATYTLYCLGHTLYVYKSGNSSDVRENQATGEQQTK